MPCYGTVRALQFVVKDHMKNFVVFVQGKNFNLEVEGKLQPAGFFASRRIEAETEEEASSAVMAQLLKEPELEGKALPEYSMIVNVAHEMPLEHKNTYSGFTLYPMEDTQSTGPDSIE